MNKREFVQLAHTYNPAKHGIGGWYVSEKLDGMRAYWDGGYTRHRLTSQVPFANTVKDHRRLALPYSTGLWSRYAKPVSAPEWWVDSLPDFPLDGELYLGPNRFQELISIVKKFEPVDEEWKKIQYRVFDLPSDHLFLMDGKINNPQWTAIFNGLRDTGPVRQYGPMDFDKIQRMIELGKITLGTGPAIWEPQLRLTTQTKRAEYGAEQLCLKAIREGGEGIILRKPESVWTPHRTWDLLKLKPWKDSEAKVIGYTWGKGKLEGLMGAMVVSWQGKTFELSGFTDEERKLTEIVHSPFKKDHLDPDRRVTLNYNNENFPRGSIVTFRYRALTDGGIPKEARYWRK